MATIRKAEARVDAGDEAIRAREVQGRVVPPEWFEAYEEALKMLLALVEAAAGGAGRDSDSDGEVALDGHGGTGRGARDDAG